MKKREYLKAVKRARRIFAYIHMTDRRNAPVRISRAKACGLVSQIGDDDTIRAKWASDDKLFLLIG